MRRYDLQVHTRASPCSRATPANIVQAALDGGLDGIAITDHDTLDGYPAVRDCAPDELAVIPGAEVTTDQGHLLALYIDEVPPQSDTLTVIEDVREQNGLVVLSHPFDRLRENYTDSLDQIAGTVDGVEVLNSRCILPRYNRRAHSFATDHGLAKIGGSDAHFPMEIGRAYTVCTGALSDCIRNSTTHAKGRGGYLSGHVGTKLNDVLKMFGK